MASIAAAAARIPAIYPAVWAGEVNLIFRYAFIRSSYKNSPSSAGAICYLYFFEISKITASGIYRITAIITKIIKISPPLMLINNSYVAGFQKETAAAIRSAFCTVAGAVIFILSAATIGI